MTQRLVTFALIVLLTLISLSASEHAANNAGLPVVEADYQRCLTVNPGPLKPVPPRLTGDNRAKEIA